MKKMKLLSVFLLTVMALSSMVACSNSDDEDSSSITKQLVGIWRTSMTSKSWKYIDIKADGSLIYGEYYEGGGKIRYSYEGNWIYNETDQTITLNSIANHYNYIYKVSMAKDGNSWNGYDTSGKAYSFIRVEP